MDTYYGQKRTKFHNIRFTAEEDKHLQQQMMKYNYRSISDFVRNAVLSKKLKVEYEQEPIKHDYTPIIKDTMKAINAVNRCFTKAIDVLEKATKTPGTNPKTIERHALTLRHYGVEMANKMDHLVNLLEKGHDV